AEDGIRDATVTGVQTCALPIYKRFLREPRRNLTRDFSRGGAAGHLASRAVRQCDLNGVHAAKSFVVETASLLGRSKAGQGATLHSRETLASPGFGTGTANHAAGSTANDATCFRAWAGLCLTALRLRRLGV